MRSSATKSAADAGGSRRFGTSLATILRANELVLFVVLLALLAIGFVLNPRFLSLDNLKVTTRDSAILGIAAIGVSFTILTGGIDLSIGSMVGLGGILVALFIQNWSLPIWLSMILTLGIALLIGLIHGLFVTKLHMHGFLITLVTLGVARGFCLVITNAFPITGLPAEFNAIGQGVVLGTFPVPVLICIGI